MGFSVYTNVLSRAIRQRTTVSTERMAQTQERLSTGLRINSAADDAAGLGISQRMDSEIRGKNVARRNIADGVSMVQTADSGLAEIGTILQKLRESAVGAANDTYNDTDRETLDDEASQLIAALNQIANSNAFNEKRLLDGTTQTVNLQTGANNRSEESVSLSFANMSASALGQLATETFATVRATAAGTLLGGGDMLINGVEIVAAQSYADEVGHSLPGNDQLSSAYAKGQAIINSNIDAKVEILASTVTHSFAAVPAAAPGYNLDVNGVAIYRSDRADTIEGLVNDLNAVSDSTGVVATVIDQNTYTLTAEDGRNINLRSGGVVGGFHGWTSGTVQHRGGLKFTSDEAIHIVGKAQILGASATDHSILPDTNSIDSHVDFTSREGALESIDRIDVAINQVLAQRSKLGSAANKLESIASSLSATNESLSAAKSRIMDADFSVESASMTRDQILQQASVAMLSQVNQAPRNLLSLIS